MSSQKRKEKQKQNLLKYPNVSFNGIPEKNQSKYIDFPKTLFGKSSRSYI